MGKSIGSIITHPGVGTPGAGNESVVISYGIVGAKVVTNNILIAINSERSYTFAISFGHVWLCQDTIGQKPIKFGK
jgi:hypothetical protein